MPTPQKVIDAIQVVAEHLRESGHEQAVVSKGGGASFHLESVFERTSDTSMEGPRDRTWGTISRLVKVGADNERSEIFKRTLRLPEQYFFAKDRALAILESHGFTAALAYLDGLEMKAEGQLERGEIVPDERARG